MSAEEYLNKKAIPFETESDHPEVGIIVWNMKNILIDFHQKEMERKLEEAQKEKYVVGINIDDKHYIHFKTTDLGFGIYAYDSNGNRVQCHAGTIYKGDFKHELYKNKVELKGLLGKFKE